MTSGGGDSSVASSATSAGAATPAASATSAPAGTAAAENEVSGFGGRLAQGMARRHLAMMGLGSAIGAGLFLGTGASISTAGPAVLISYIVAGAIVVLVMRMLGEMAAAMPSAGSFATYAGAAYGRHARFVVGWMYWFMLVMVMASEMTGAAAIIAHWFGIPTWVPALVCMVFFAVVNLVRVRAFGEFEFWFSLIKVAVIIAFLVIGVLVVFGLLPDTEPVGTANLLGHGGFMPNGWAGVAAGLLAVAFAFGGIEIVAIAAAESDDPARNVGSAVRSVIWRIGLFYVGSVLVIAALIPWDSLAGADTAEQSPFTAVLRMANLPGVVGFLEVIIALALLSAFNAQIYGTSRIAFALAKQGDGPRVLARTNRAAAPSVSVYVSVFFGFVAVALQWFEWDGLLNFLLNAVGATLLVVWIAIALSQLRLRSELERTGRLTVRMWLHPWLGILAVVVTVALGALMLTDDEARKQIFGVVGLVVVLGILSLVNARFHADSGAHVG